MKKIISLLLAVCIVMSVSITAFASESFPNGKTVQGQAIAAAEYVCENDGAETYALKDFFDVIPLIECDCLDEDAAKAFVNEAKVNLDENEGKLLLNGQENMALYIAVIEVLERLEIDAETFGYDLVAIVSEMDTSAVFSNPYYYAVVIPEVNYRIGRDFALELAQTLTKNFYVTGKGMSYYPITSGSEFFSCDNNAYYIMAVSLFYDEFKQQIDDAISINENLCRIDGGYTSDYKGSDWYYPAVSTDSTALMLKAYSSLVINSLKLDCSITATKAYKELSALKEDDGGYTGWDKVYSTRNALRGLTVYTFVADILSSFEEGWFENPSTGDYYYFGDNTIETGWVKSPLSGRWYYMDETTGIMQTGWIKDEGKWYYLNSQGAMQKGWINDGGYWYFLTGDGSMATGWVKDGGKWYYTNTHGVMLKGWQRINGTWYYLNDSGSMRTGWLLDNGKWYYLNASGAMRTSSLTYKGKVYNFNSSGACVNP